MRPPALFSALIELVLVLAPDVHVRAVIGRVGEANTGAGLELA